MTVLAAVVRDGQVTMGADSASIMAGIVTHDAGKIRTWTVGTDWAGTEQVAIGFAGLAQLGDMAQRHLELDDPPPRGESLRPWMLGIAEAICTIATEAKPPAVDSDGWVDGCALVGFRGQLWVLAQQAADPLPDGFAATGAAGEVALGYLAAVSESDMPPVVAVTHAIAVACRFCDTADVGPDGPQIVQV